MILMCLFTDLHAIHEHGTWASHCQIFHHGEAFSRLGPSQKQRNHPPGWMQMRGLLCFVGRGPCKLVILCKFRLNVSRVTRYHRISWWRRRSHNSPCARVARRWPRSKSELQLQREQQQLAPWSWWDRKSTKSTRERKNILSKKSIIERQGNGFRLIDPVFYFCVSEVWIAWKLLCRGGWRAAGGEGSCRIDAGQIESQHVASSGWLHMEHHRTRRGGTCPAGNLYLMCWWPKTMSMQQLHSGAWMKFTMLQHFSFIFL